MKYYFLVSYLPEIQRDDQKLKLHLKDLLSERYLFDDRDWKDIELLLLGGDILQLERLFSGKETEVEYSLYGRSFWKEQMKSPKQLPEFLVETFEDLTSEGPTPGNLDRLYAAYYTYAGEGAGSAFLRTYLAFEKDLRNIVAAIRARRRGLPPSDYVVGEDDLVDRLSRSTAEDFGLYLEYPWIERLIAVQEPVETEEAVQQVIWDVLEEMTEHLEFDFDVVLAYLLRLQIVERNLSLSEEKGMETVRQLEGL